jgi:hypothetical protein
MPVAPLALGLTAVAFADDGDFLACTVPKDSMRCDRAGLESMWDDYYDSVNSLIEALKQDRARLDETLTWWNGRRWTVQQFGWTPVLMTASASASAIELSQVRDVVP